MSTRVLATAHLPAGAAAVVWAGLCLSACTHSTTRSATTSETRQERVAADPAAMMRIGQAAEAADDWASAETFYRRASELDPDLAEASLGEARVLAHQGDMDGALRHLGEDHRRHVDDVATTAALGRMLIVESRPGDALKVFDEGLARQPASIPLQIGKGVALDESGRHAEAQEIYRAVLRADPDNSSARANLDRSQRLRSPARTDVTSR